MKTKLKNKIIPFLLVVCLLFMSGCTTSNVGDETTEPLDKLINGLLNEDITLYKSAFSPEFIKKLTESYSIVGQEIDTVLTETIKGAMDAHIVNYGEKIRINYKLISKEVMTKEQLDEPYMNYYDITYDLPIDSITEAYKATIDITVSGKDSSETQQAVYKLLKIDGVWYLHPETFMNVFSG